MRNAQLTAEFTIQCEFKRKNGVTKGLFLPGTGQHAAYLMCAFWSIKKILFRYTSPYPSSLLFFMNKRAASIIGWTCAILVAALNIFAAVMKFVPITPGSPAEEFGRKVGTLGLEYQLGVLEIAITALFLIPRTSTVGFVLMVGYLAGALATNITHGFSTMEVLPLYIALLLLTVSAYFRSPELLSRLLGRPMPTDA